jgi:hypothetical protein
MTSNRAPRDCTLSLRLKPCYQPPEPEYTTQQRHLPKNQDPAVNRITKRQRLHDDALKMCQAKKLKRACELRLRPIHSKACATVAQCANGTVRRPTTITFYTKFMRGTASITRVPAETIHDYTAARTKSQHYKPNYLQRR